jgi:hypothetical protein
MPFKIIKPIVDLSVRQLCVRPYPLHKKGCPNFNKRQDCPPLSPPVFNIFHMDKPVYAIWNCFNIGEHVEKMKMQHPLWTERQLYCCLYWQPRARKQLETEILSFRMINFNNVEYNILRCPEASGVDITGTMKSINVLLEWPPVKYAYQVALAGHPII